MIRIAKACGGGQIHEPVSCDQKGHGKIEVWCSGATDCCAGLASFRRL